MSEPAGKVMLRPSSRARSIEMSEIVRISEEAARLRAAGRDIISFGTGEPDFPTPPAIVEVACRAASRGETRYTPTAGTPALRAATTMTNPAKNQ